MSVLHYIKSVNLLWYMYLHSQPLFCASVILVYVNRDIHINVHTRITVCIMLVQHCLIELTYRRNWLLSACAYSSRQKETMRLIKSMRLTASVCLIERASPKVSSHLHIV